MGSPSEIVGDFAPMRRKFSNLQWYLAHSHSTVHVAAYSSAELTRSEFVKIVNHSIKSAPQLLWSENLIENCHISNDNPDVDAMYRMSQPLPVSFETSSNIALGQGSYCPFNSQNTT